MSGEQCATAPCPEKGWPRQSGIYIYILMSMRMYVHSGLFIFGKIIDMIVLLPPMSISQLHGMDRAFSSQAPQRMCMHQCSAAVITIEQQLSNGK